MKQLSILLISIFAIVGCKKPPEVTDFDRGAMLTDMSSSIIQPAYDKMSTSLTSLKLKSVNFNASPTLTTLNEIKTAFNQAYLDFEACKMLNFGSMDDYGIVGAMNTYPIDSNKINSNISNGNYTLGAVDNIQAIGLPTVDFLLYHKSELEIITEFTINTEAANRKTYLFDICEKMENEFNLVLNEWNTSKVGFAESNGNDIGSSTSLLFNAFVKDLELIKNAKIGIPAGYQTAGETLPHYVESFYSAQSIDLAVANLNALKNVFNGGELIGFDDYIRDVEGGTVENSLADNINAQFDAAIAATNAINNPFSDQVDANAAAVLEAFNEVKALLTYIKTDMSSILGLLITFQDNDGD